MDRLCRWRWGVLLGLLGPVVLSATAAPPPLETEPFVPPITAEEELERDPGGVLVLPNVRVNDSPGGCVDDSVDNFCAQNETTLAINPADNDNWVGGANDYSGDNVVGGRAQSNCGVYTSTDAGQTWSHQLLPNQPGFNMGGDPSIAFDQNGNVYYACMNNERTSNFGIDAWAMFVFKSTDGGLNFGAPTEVISVPSPQAADKEMIATGIVTDNVYMAWYDGNNIRFAGSDDGGASFAAPAADDSVIVNDAGSGQGAVVATRFFPGAGDTSDSEHVYVAWMDTSNNRILFDRSTNNGLSFGEDVVVEGNVTEFPHFTIDAGTGPSENPVPAIVGEHGAEFGNDSNAFRVNSFPAMDVCNDPSSDYFGNVYIVFADARFGDGDIFLKWSENGGETWPGATNTTRVNNDAIGNGVDQFFPWIDVDEDCKINVAFYDRRDDAPRFHLYLAHSEDGGERFDEFRVSTAPSTNAQFWGGFIGDYLQVAATTADSASFHHQVDRAAVLWMDTREGAQDVYAATVLQTNGGTWINVDVDLVADQPATDLDFVFPGDVSDDFGAIYHGDANPFQDHEITYDADSDSTLLSFVAAQPGPLQPGDLAHVGFLLEANVPTIDTFWTGSGNIGAIPLTTLDVTYDPQDRVVTAQLCNDRSDGQTIAVAKAAYAVLELPVELEALNADDLPGALAAQGGNLAPLPAGEAPLASGDCYSAEIPDTVAPFEAVVLSARLAFPDGRGRAKLFAQKIAKDGREVDGPPRKRFHYLAKLVCGTQSETTDLRLARGHYATTINAFNLDDRPALLSKTLSLALPPGHQRPGRRLALGRDTLPPGHALATECDDIRRRIFGGALPSPIIDGYLSIVSDRRLEVTGVYSTATLNAEGTAEHHSAIHIERATERRLKPDKGVLRADLVIGEELPVDAICTPRRCRVSLRFTVRNIGTAGAGPFAVAIVRGDSGSSLASVPIPGGLEPAASVTESLTLGYRLEPGDRREVCLRADAPLSEVDESNEDNNQRCIDF